MKLSNEQKFNLAVAVERVTEKCNFVRRKRKVALGISAAPRPNGYVENDPLLSKIDTDWVDDINPENKEFDELIKSILNQTPKADTSEFPKLDESNFWLWGGPTPFWGGTMADDTLVVGADYFGAKNVVYVYGPTNDKMLAMHSKYQRMLCQINDNCRTPGAQEGNSNEENAENLSKLSLKYPNITGAMCDDVEASFVKLVLPDKFKTRYQALKKFNAALKMYGVIYVHNLFKDFSLIQQYLDVVNLWFWNKDEILEFDENIALCQEKFPGKPILLGVFLHEYGRADAGNVPELLCYQLDKAREYIAKGIVEGVVLLGDREIKKWPDVAEKVKYYLENQ